MSGQTEARAITITYLEADVAWRSDALAQLEAAGVDDGKLLAEIRARLTDAQSRLAVAKRAELNKGQ